MRRRCGLRLSTAIGRFDSQLQADGKSEHTCRAYLRDLAKFKAWLWIQFDLLPRGGTAELPGQAAASELPRYNRSRRTRVTSKGSPSRETAKVICLPSSTIRSERSSSVNRDACS